MSGNYLNCFHAAIKAGLVNMNAPVQTIHVNHDSTCAFEKTDGLSSCDCLPTLRIIDQDGIGRCIVKDGMLVNPPRSPPP